MCEPVWKSTDCILCWEGVWNAIQEFRFLLYFLDLLSVIFIFGKYQSLRYNPYELILTKVLIRNLYTKTYRVHWLPFQTLPTADSDCGHDPHL